MKYLSKIFLRGLFTLLPFVLTVVILLGFLTWAEGFAERAFSVLPGDFYFPGLGFVIGISLILLLGFMTTLPVMKRVLLAVELPFKNVPIIKSVYSAVKNLADFFSPEGEAADQQVVVVRIPGFAAEVVGFVTRKNLNDLPNEFTKEDRVAVFIPLSYQVGGLTVFIPRSWVTRTNLSVETAMRSALTAWMPGRDLN